MCFSSFCYKYIDSTNLFQFLFSVKAKVTLFEFVILVIGFIFFSLLEIDKYLKRKSTSKSIPRIYWLWKFICEKEILKSWFGNSFCWFGKEEEKSCNDTNDSSEH